LYNIAMVSWLLYTSVQVTMQVFERAKVLLRRDRRRRARETGTERGTERGRERDIAAEGRMYAQEDLGFR
jgi:hypothetical protein